MELVSRGYAKINLYLDITGVRADGYHTLDTVMQAVSLYDEITVTTCEDDITVNCDRENLSGEDNIAYKACVGFFGLLGRSFGVIILINNNIPVSSGLGGGSSDAATVLLMLNELAGKPFSRGELLPLATSLGADVPFFLFCGTAKAEGIGELLTTVPSKTFHYVLLKEGQKQSTGKMYSILNSTPYNKSGDIDLLLSAAKNGDTAELAKNIFNAFEFCWDMETLSAPLKDYNPVRIFLSGSGPTVVALFDSEENAKNCERALKAKNFNAFYAKTV